MTTEQLAGWAKYYECEPWGFPVQDAWHGIIGATIASAAGAQDITPAAFMLGNKGPQPEAQVEADATEHLKRIFGFAPPAPADDAQPGPPTEGG